MSSSRNQKPGSLGGASEVSLNQHQPWGVGVRVVEQPFSSIQLALPDVVRIFIHFVQIRPVACVIVDAKDAALLHQTLQRCRQVQVRCTCDGLRGEASQLLCREVLSKRTNRLTRYAAKCMLPNCMPVSHGFQRGAPRMTTCTQKKCAPS